MTTNPVYELLICARAKIADPAHWTREVEARDDLGVPCAPTYVYAKQWCALGALTACTTTPFDTTFDDALEVLAERAMSFIEYVIGDDRLFEQMHAIVDESGWVAAVNDVLGHEKVLELYDDASRAVAEDQS